LDDAQGFPVLTLGIKPGVSPRSWRLLSMEHMGKSTTNMEVFMGKYHGENPV